MKDIMQLLHAEDVKQEKFRNELKYICTEGELQIIQARIQTVCKRDIHAGPTGIYGIRSVYFDDPQDLCLKENENGNDPREKFRIRIYNAQNNRITLECKKKERAMTHKDSCRLTLEQYNEIMNGAITPRENQNPLLRKLAFQISSSALRPKVIAAYERTPFVYPAGNVRLTFDRNIGSSTGFDEFFEENLSLRPILSKGQHVLEVKYDEFLPDFLYRLLELGSLRQTAFSKYALCRYYSR